MILRRVNACIVLIIFIVLSGVGVVQAGIFQKENKMDQAVFAAGCFWGVEKIFSKIEGVTKTDVGYAGGHVDQPSYHLVTTGRTGHAEAVRIIYNPEKVTYKQLLAVFFQWHDPTTMNQQGPDKGSQYRSAIFTADETQMQQASLVINTLNQSGIYDDTIVTEISNHFTYYPAEDYQQKYLEKNPKGYCSHFLQKKEIPVLLGVDPVHIKDK